MWQPAVTIVAPAAEPVDLTVAAPFLNGIAADEEGLVRLLIAAARGHVEAYTGLRLVPQTLELRASGFEDLRHFPVGPLRAVSSLAYLDGAGGAQTLDPSTYERCGAGITAGVRARVGVTWPVTRPGVDDAVVLTATFGFDPGAVPTPIIHSILLLLGDLYANREDTIAERGVTPATLPNGITALLANWRLF